MACVLASGVKTREVNPVPAHPTRSRSTLPGSLHSSSGPAGSPSPSQLYMHDIRLPLPTLDLIGALGIIHFSLIPGYQEHLLCIRTCARYWDVLKEKQALVPALEAHSLVGETNINSSYKTV